MAVVGSLLGCGGKGGEKEFANKPPSEKILGNWKGKKVFDEEAMKKWAEEEGIIEESIERAKQSARELTHYFDFKEDGTGRQVRQYPDWTGFEEFKWEIASSNQESEEVRLTLTFEAHGFTKVVSYDITLQDQDGPLIAKPVPDPDSGPQPPNTQYRFERVEEIPQDTRVKEAPAKTVVK